MVLNHYSDSAAWTIIIRHRVGKLSQMEVFIKRINSGKPAVISLRLFDLVCSDI